LPGIVIGRRFGRSARPGVFYTNERIALPLFFLPAALLRSNRAMMITKRALAFGQWGGLQLSPLSWGFGPRPGKSSDQAFVFSGVWGFYMLARIAAGILFPIRALSVACRVPPALLVACRARFLLFSWARRWVRSRMSLASQARRQRVPTDCWRVAVSSRSHHRHLPARAAVRADVKPAG